MWSLGVCLYESLVGETPFKSKSLEDLLVDVNKGCVRLPLSKDMSDECLDLLVKCLHFDPESRISAKKAL